MKRAAVTTFVLTVIFGLAWLHFAPASVLQAAMPIARAIAAFMGNAP